MQSNVRCSSHFGDRKFAMKKFMNTSSSLAYMRSFLTVGIVLCVSCSELLPSEEDGRELVEYEEDYLRIASIDKFAFNSGNFEVTFTGTAIIEEQVVGKKMDPAQIAESCGLENFHSPHASDLNAFRVLAIPGDEVRFSAKIRMIRVSQIKNPELKKKVDGTNYPETRNGWTGRNYHFSIYQDDAKRWFEGHPAPQYSPYSGLKSSTEAIIFGTSEFRSLCHEIKQRGTP